MISFGKNFFSEPMGVFLVLHDDRFNLQQNDDYVFGACQITKEKRKKFVCLTTQFFFLNARYISIESTWRQIISKIKVTSSK
jgi:hypothetical protein